MRNRSDELAVEAGCWFDVERGAYTVWWIERYCRLYEGEHAGEYMLLRSGCKEADEITYGNDRYASKLKEWESAKSHMLKRAAIYGDWLQSGEDIQPDWQYECMMRLFGWSRFSERWQRNIRRFNAASIWVPKKQKKTPTEAAVGLYLTCGDGEPGAKTFQGAKDGNQAGIAMAHAIAMVEQSPELASECKLNRNEKSIEHMPTRSKYKPLSSANERTKNSKEGLNGNILIDETHVVDRDFINIISRAGISRSEPMQFEVSTAGNNPDGYGRERQDYARQVECGAIQNDQLFVAIYEAPAKLTDEQLAADPVKYGRMANPAWGHTAHEEEYLADYQQSRRTISGLAQFKMYRLNIWQTTANQWLRLDDWLACGQSELDLEDFSGEMAAIGMDLSKTKDMSAISVSIPRGEHDYLFVDMWMTEDYARENKDKAAFLEWAAAGQLNLIPGSVIQENVLRERFAELCKLLKIKVFVKDKTYATDFTEWVEENYSSILQVDYPQYANAMEKPIDDFEADVIDCKIQHHNNACLNWQAGHAAVHENGRGFRLIQKPKRGDVRKVDGLVASLMSHWGAKQLPKKNSVYRRRGVLCA